MTSFKKLMQKQEDMVARLVEYSEIEKELVENIVQYAKNLAQPGTQEITDNTFVIQMMSQFHITNQIMMNQMFEVLHRRRKNLFPREMQSLKPRVISLEDYCSCICVFLSENMAIKVDWVFSVYDTNNDGHLHKMDLYYLLKPCVLHSEEMDTEEAIKDLIDIVLTVVDLDKSGSIDLFEFRELVKRNVLYIDLLGQCLPNEHVVTRFVKKIQNKSPAEVSKMFEEELDRALVIPTVTPESTLYPIHLDLP